MSGREPPQDRATTPLPARSPRGSGPATAAALAAIAAIAHAETGIVLPADGTAMLQARLGRRLRRLGLADYPAYLAYLGSPAGPAERRHFISALTTNESQFFREPHHFDLLRDAALPRLIARARAGARVRIWSAGCAKGQEAYSAAMVLLDLMPDAGRHDIRILATDIDRDMIERGARAIFPAAELALVPAALRHRFIEADGAGFRPSAAVRDLLRLRALNLHDDWPIRQDFDVILCRNVAIYFAPAAQARLWRRMRAALAPDGWLFIGHAERLPQDVAAGFHRAGVTSYRPARPAATC